MKALRTFIILSAIASLAFSMALAADMDGLMMSAGKVVMVQQGHPSAPLDHEMTMSDGSTLKPDGTILRKDGIEVHLQNGDVIMPDGHVMHGGKAAPMCR